MVPAGNALGTAFFRADFFPSQGEANWKKALWEYNRTRSIAPGTAVTEEGRKAFLDRSPGKQSHLLSVTRKVIAQDHAIQLGILLITAINDILDANTIRLAAIFDRLPPAVIWLLILVSSSALTVAGNNAGLQGRTSRWRMGAFTIVLAAITLLILDFDCPNDGIILSRQ